jgi:cytochrome P450
MTSAPSGAGTRRLPPGPRGHPLFGSAAAIRRDPLAAYEALARDYGDVVRIRFVLWPTYMLFHPDHVRHVLQEKHSLYSKDLYTYHLLKPVVGNGLVTNDGPGWLRQRRLVQPAFHRSRLGAVEQVVAAAIERMFERWEEAGRRGEAVDLRAEMTRMTLQVAGEALFQVDLSAESDEAGRAFEAVNRLLTDYVYLPLPPLAVPSPRNLRLRSARNTLDRLVRRIITERRREGGDRGDLLSVLLTARDEVITLLFAGHDTSASALTWACYLAARHPDAADRIRRDQDVEPAYARMVFEETLRLYPPGWSFGRKALRDDVIGGYDVPAGSLVWVSPYVTHRLEAFWPRPLEFDPERFTPEASAGRHKFAYFPFASGPRICLGSHFAVLVGQRTLEAVFKSFRLRFLSERAPQPEALITLKPRDPLPVVPERV